MLAACGIIPEEDARTIIKGLEELAADFRAGKVELDPACEDIHMLVERRLYERIGPAAGRLHTARSRNDQVALDLRLWCRDAARRLDESIAGLQATLLTLAEEHVETLLPGYTHLQRAQPVTLGHHLLAYFWMLDRDRSRLQDWRSRSNFCPLGAAAMAGTSLPVDREMTARELGFEAPIPNSMDAVSDRDFALELAFICSMVMTHLSRLAEEAVIWSSAEFGFLELDDSVATGSSIMPQKKNPDVAELTRAKTGRVHGALVALLTILKGLPLTYMRDLQEDKPPLFDAVDNTLACLKAMERLLAASEFCTDRMAKAADDGFATATDLAEYLVRRGVPFREAHEVVGNLVRSCLDQGRRLDSLSPEELAQAHHALGADATESLKTTVSLHSRNHTGGCAPAAVRRQLEQAREAFQKRQDSQAD
jgi:argininosuccinate lyase